MTKISGKEKTELVRKGNMLFNEGKIEQAAKIFEAVHYVDGLIRIGDYYYGKNELVNSIVYYKKANYKKRITQLAPGMATVFKTWFEEDKKEV